MEHLKQKFKQTEIGKIPEDWEELSAEKFCVKVTDGTHDSPKKQNKGKYLITSRHIKEGKLDFDNAYFISEENFNEVNKRSKVDQWDLIFGMIGTIGETYLEKNKNPDYAIKNVGLFKTGSEIKGKWIFYFLKSLRAKDYIFRQSAGTTQQYITLDSLRNFPILFPKDPKEQLSIASILSSLDEKIEVNNKINKTLESIGQVIFKKWFIENKSKNEKRLGDILLLEYGKGLPINQRKEGRIPIYGSGGLMGFNNEFLVKGPGIIVGRAGCPGRIHLIKEDFWPVDSTFYVSSKEEYFFYIYYLLKFIDLSFLNSGSAVPGLNRNTAYEQKINFPNEIYIKEFNNFCKSLFYNIWENERQNKTLSSIRDALLPKLMSGEIRVK